MHSPRSFDNSVTIKSKYLSTSQNRRLAISPQTCCLSIGTTNPTRTKQFHINDINSHQTLDKGVKISLKNGRQYQIQTQHAGLIVRALEYARDVQRAGKFVEQTQQIPKSFDYVGMSQKYMDFGSQKFLPLQSPILMSQKISPSKAIAKRQYKISKYFVIPQNWQRDPHTGKMTVINQQWKNNTTKIIGFLVKKFLTSGSFMGISFPCFAMKGQSILQTYAKSIGAAARLFGRDKDHLQRMKKFICFIFTMSSLHVDMVKPFNPTIGETYQAQIGGGMYSAQQISHHPPISGFYYQNKGYKIYGQMQMRASIGINSGEGLFVGDVKLQFKDGHIIQGRLPNGQLSGFLIGDYLFQTYRGAYAFDNDGLNCTYQLNTKNNVFEGVIGYLNQQSKMQFKQQMTKQNRYWNYSAFPTKAYSRIFSRMAARPIQWVTFDQTMYFDFDDVNNLPYLPQDIVDKRLLLGSDSRHRKDIAYRIENQYDLAQEEKERIENQERANRKLREQYSKK